MVIRWAILLIMLRLTGSTKDTRVYRSAVLNARSKDDHPVLYKVNLMPKFRYSKLSSGS